MQTKIDEAVERGAIYLTKLLAGNFLKRQQPPDDAGVGALIGWTLLESGLPASDPKLQMLAEQVRQMAIDNSKTYSISFTMIFLDRLGEKADALLIQALGTRLLEGQMQTGGWSYHCLPGSKAAEKDDLRSYYELLRKNETNKAKAKQVALQHLFSARSASVNRTPLLGMKAGTTDNSNTQLAALALWVARRHGIPADRALQLAAIRFRNTQQRDGKWGYDIERPDYGQAMSMTCAGLIVMALGKGAVAQTDLTKSLAGDPSIARGFIALHSFIRAGLPRLTFKDIEQITANSNTFYSLWSLERTCMMYNLDKVFGEEWYAWGAKYLLETQQPEGNWTGHYDRHFAADTCFALLFLRRANPARDLATKIKSKLNFAVPLQKSSRSSTLPSPSAHSSADFGVSGYAIVLRNARLARAVSTALWLCRLSST